MAASFEKLRGLRIFVAEDETLILMEIEGMLQDLGCEIVGSAPTVATALSAIQSNELDGALLDINLRGEVILPVVKKLLVRGVPFLLVTGYASRIGEHGILRDAPRLSKPFSFQNLGMAMIDAFATHEQTSPRLDWRQGELPHGDQR